MKKWLIVGVSAVLCAVVLGAYAYTFTSWGDMFKPSITGDRAADATCAAGIAPFIENGQPQTGKLLGMTLEERQDMATALGNVNEDVTIPEIKEAATAVLGGLLISGEGTGLFGQIGFISSMGRLAEACTANGWDAKKAGLW